MLSRRDGWIFIYVWEWRTLAVMDLALRAGCPWLELLGITEGSDRTPAITITFTSGSG